MGSGPAAIYLAKYNTYVLPGYVQNESFDSTMNVANHQAPFADGSESEYMGLENKMLSLTMKVWENDYSSCKGQVQQAATVLRSKRSGFSPLYIQYTDKHYDALVKSVKMEKTAGTSIRTLEYQVDFECKPWLISDNTSTISNGAIGGTPTTLSTAGRTLDDGGWTPTTITVTGTNVTISGYTASEFAGFISISGAVTSMVIDSDLYTATIGGVNKNSYMRSVDYRVFVGPEITNFYITGAQSCSISYNNRWYI
jgi:hypothetical protein